MSNGKLTARNTSAANGTMDGYVWMLQWEEGVEKV